MTIKDIAKLAGVASSTVSRVINYPDGKHASREVQDRIWAIIREYNFVPNASARSLKQGKRTHSLPSNKTFYFIFNSPRDEVTDYFSSKISRSVEKEAIKHGYTAQHITLTEVNQENIDGMNAAHTKGAILIGRYTPKLISFLKSKIKHLVYIGYNGHNGQIDQITCDGHAIATQAVEHLVKQGHTRIGYIGLQKNDLRFKGYLDTLARHRLDFSHRSVVEILPSFQQGYLAAQKLFALKERPSAVFCVDDATAIGFIKAADKFGISLPYECSIIGVDDIELTQYVSPMLTTIRIPINELSILAIRTLIERLECNWGDPIRLSLKIELPFQLVRRESVVPYRRY